MSVRHNYLKDLIIILRPLKNLYINIQRIHLILLNVPNETHLVYELISENFIYIRKIFLLILNQLLLEMLSNYCLWT